jgi:hypothetical protein
MVTRWLDFLRKELYASSPNAQYIVKVRIVVSKQQFDPKLYIPAGA